MPIVDKSRATRMLWLASAVGVVLCGATLAQLADRLGPFTVAMILTYAVIAILIVILTEVFDIGSGAHARARCRRAATRLPPSEAARPHRSTGTGSGRLAPRRCRPSSDRRCTRSHREDMS